MARKILRDDQWARIKDLLPGKPGDKGVTAADNRLFVEAVLWLLRTGAPWRDLPPEFGRWRTAYLRFARWHKSGVWARLFQAVAGTPISKKCSSTARRSAPTCMRPGAPKKTVRSHWAALAAAGAPRST